METFLNFEEVDDHPEGALSIMKVPGIEQNDRQAPYMLTNLSLEITSTNPASRPTYQQTDLQ